MARPGPPSPLRSEDYDAIQAAVMETARGRWFLSEFAKRNRSADTDILLDAIEKLHNSLVTHNELPENTRIKTELLDIAGAIASTKQEIAAMTDSDGNDDKITTASMELDAIVTTAEKATGDILNIAEQIQEIGWTLREGGIDEKSCDALDRHATDIYTACSFQDLTGQRTQKVIKILSFIDQRIEAMMAIWQPDEQAVTAATQDSDKNSRPDDHLLNGPQFESVAPSQEDIDEVLADDNFYPPVIDIDEAEIIEPDPTDNPEPSTPSIYTSTRICWSEEPGKDQNDGSPNEPVAEMQPEPPDISASSDEPTPVLEPDTDISALSSGQKMALFT